MQKLTLAKVRAAARKAYKERRLTAQHRDPSKRECVYSYGKYGCAIGVALNKKTIKKILDDSMNSGTSLGQLRDNYVKIPEKEFHHIVAIQVAHDDWVLGGSHFSYNDKVVGRERKEYRNKFKELIGL